MEYLRLLIVGKRVRYLKDYLFYILQRRIFISFRILSEIATYTISRRSFINGISQNYSYENTIGMDWIVIVAGTSMWSKDWMVSRQDTGSDECQFLVPSSPSKNKESFFEVFAENILGISPFLRLPMNSWMCLGILRMLRKSLLSPISVLHTFSVQ